MSDEGTERRWERRWFFLVGDRLCYTRTESQVGRSAEGEYLPLDRIPVRPRGRKGKPGIGVRIVGWGWGNDVGSGDGVRRDRIERGGMYEPDVSQAYGEILATGALNMTICSRTCSGGATRGGTRCLVR